MINTLTVRRKTNKKFMFLSALGIIMVVDAHAWTALGLFTEFIPYNSFFMPMFVFISGYFNKIDGDTDLKPYCYRKLKNLLIPYLAIVFVSFWLEWIMDWIKLGQSPKIRFPDDLESIIMSVITDGDPVSICSPMWFVPTLFTLLITYSVIKKCFYKYWNGIVMLIVFCIFSTFVVWLAQNIKIPHILLLPCKCLFFLPYLELGIIYRERIEPKTERRPKSANIVLLALLLLVNMIRMMILPNSSDIGFINLAYLSGFTSPYIITPMISSIVGISFWVIMIDTIGKAFYDNRLVNYISENTLWILGFHVFFFNILNFLLFFWNNAIAPIQGFDIESFRQTTWYRWEFYKEFRLTYFLVGLVGPLLLKLLVDHLKLLLTLICKKKDN